MSLELMGQLAALITFAAWGFAKLRMFANMIEDMQKHNDKHGADLAKVCTDLKGAVDTLNAFKERLNETHSVALVGDAKAEAALSLRPNTAWLITDTEGNNVSVSKEYTKLLNCSEAELKGKHYINKLHPEERGLIEQHWALCRKNDIDYHSIHRLETPNGYVWVETVITPLPRLGQTIVWLGVITKLKDQENVKYQQL